MLGVAPYVNRSINFGLSPAEGSPLLKWFERVKEVPSVKETIAEMLAGVSNMAAMKGAFKAGSGFRREYRDHRLVCERSSALSWRYLY